MINTMQEIRNINQPLSTPSLLSIRVDVDWDNVILKTTEFSYGLHTWEMMSDYRVDKKGWVGAVKIDGKSKCIEY